MIQTEIQKLLKRTLKSLDLPEIELEVSHPDREQHGDLNSNAALVLAKITKNNPHKLAQELVEKLGEKADEMTGILRVEVGGAGFINFWLSEQYLLDEAKRAVDLGESYGKNRERDQKKVLLEFTDPNPFKEFHIGHLYSNVVGESLARMIEASGAHVKRANYQGDVGLHVAKAIYGLMQVKDIETKLKVLESKSLDKKVSFLGKAYASGARAFEKSKDAKMKIEDLNQKIYREDQEIRDLYEKGREWSLEYFEKIYKRLGTKFDFYYFERKAGRIGLRVVKDNLENGVFEKSEGAIIFPGEKYGLHTRVFVNSKGLPTYEAKDLGLAETKYKDFAYDQSIIITGNEVDEYFKVIIKALSKVNPKLAEKTLHISHGMVRLPEGKMSSRTGKVMSGERLLDEAKSRVLGIIEKSGELEGVLREKTAEMVGVGAVKYSLLKSSIGRDISFNFDESVSLEGNSGPYLQYTHARAQSVLQKSNSTFKGSTLKGGWLNAEELSVLRWIYRYPEAVAEAQSNWAPNKVCEFLFELAQRYNGFYNRHRILQAEDEQKKKLRLLVTQAVSLILENGLYLLGIQAPGKM